MDGFSKGIGVIHMMCKDEFGRKTELRQASFCAEPMLGCRSLTPPSPQRAKERLRHRFRGMILQTAWPTHLWSLKSLQAGKVPSASQLLSSPRERYFFLDNSSLRLNIFVLVDSKRGSNLSFARMLGFRQRRAIYGIHARMKKRTESDWTSQVISSKRALNNANYKRRYNKLKSEQSKSRLLSRTVVLAPPILSFFHKQYNSFSVFISDILENCEKGQVVIDLSKVRKAKVSALLVLYANIEQIQKIHKNPSIIKTKGLVSREVAIMFRTFGLWTLTGESNIHSARAYPDSLEICTMPHEANDARNHKKELRKILKYAQSNVMKVGMHEGTLLAYNAITESISNVWQHAYDDVFFKEPVPIELRNWWIIVQCVQDQFFVSMYDMGAGIPTTINTKPWAAALIESISKLFEKTGFIILSADAKSIKAAVDYGKSRFKQDNRGKGLTEAKDFVQRNPQGSLLIFSGQGYYKYKTEGDEESLETLSTPFKGTLIQWNLKLEKKDDV